MEMKANDSVSPAIRVFLSSTFADMQMERNYFNQVLAPKLSAVCADRGISFFAVDLRWGITQEDQISGKVVPLCLREIDRCRPYFIGILGERYGTVAEKFTSRQYEMIPWLKGHEGRSVTELEMLYGVLERESADCLFLLRDPALSREIFPKRESADREERLLLLKKEIREKLPDNTASYSSMEEFGDRILAAFHGWLDREFPKPEDVSESRLRFYRTELLRDFLPNREMEDFLNAYLKSSARPLLIYDAKMSGKSALLNAWEPAGARRVVVNCASDSRFVHWPQVALEIMRQAERTGTAGPGGLPQNAASAGRSGGSGIGTIGSTADMYGMSASQSLRSRKDEENFQRKFRSWLSAFQPDEETVIILNDLNLLENRQSRLLSWLPAVLPARVHLIASSNDADMAEDLKELGWNVSHMLGFGKEIGRQLLKNRLAVFGKGLSERQLALFSQSPILQEPGRVRQLTTFLNLNGSFENLDSFAENLSEIRDASAFLAYLYDYAMKGFSPVQARLFATLLGILTETSVPLRELECAEICADFLSFTRVDWSSVRIQLEMFFSVGSDLWIVRDRALREVCEKKAGEEQAADGVTTAGEAAGGDPAAKLQAALAHFFMGQLEKAAEESRQTSDGDDAAEEDTGIRTAGSGETGDGSDAGMHMEDGRTPVLAKAVLYHLERAGEWQELSDALCSLTIFRNLYQRDLSAIRSGWVQVLEHMDLPAVRRLYDLIDRIQAGHESDLEHKVRAAASLFVDLELAFDVTELKRRAGVVPGSELEVDWSRLSSPVRDLYDQAVMLQNHAQFREEYDLLKKALAAAEEAEDAGMAAGAGQTSAGGAESGPAAGKTSAGEAESRAALGETPSGEAESGAAAGQAPSGAVPGSGTGRPGAKAGFQNNYKNFSCKDLFAKNKNLSDNYFRKTQEVRRKPFAPMTLDPVGKMILQNRLAYAACAIGLPDAVTECDKAYRAALREGDFGEMLFCLLVRNRDRYNRKQYAEAAENFVKTENFALEHGSLREYAMCRNFRGMCAYHLDRYDESIRLLRSAIDIWKRVGLAAEAATVGINLSNAYYLKDDVQEAVNLLKEMLGLLDEAERLEETNTANNSMQMTQARRVRTRIEGNLAALEGRLKDMRDKEGSGQNQEAEQAAQSGQRKQSSQDLRIAAQLARVQKAREEKDEEFCLQSLIALANLYEEAFYSDKLADVIDEIMDLCLKRKNWGMLAQWYQRSQEALAKGHYFQRALDTEKKWKPVLKQQGVSLDEMSHKDERLDNLKLGDLQEALVLARAAKDAPAQRKILDQLAEEIRQSDPEKAADFYLQSEEVCRQIPGENGQDRLTMAIICLLEADRVRDPEWVQQLVGQVNSSVRQDLFGKWIAVRGLGDVSKGSAAELSVGDSVRSAAGMSAGGSARSSAVREGLHAIAELVSAKGSTVDGEEGSAGFCAEGSAVSGEGDDAGADHETAANLAAAAHFLRAIAGDAIRCGSGQDIARIGEVIAAHPDQEALIMMKEALSEAYVAFFTSEIGRLMQNFTGTEAEKNLKIAEEGIHFLNQAGDETAYALAGNLALIFRRRKDKEKTYRYHQLSMEGYREIGSVKDELIEMMNFSTACEEFGEMEKAAGILRDAVARAREHDEEGIEASLCGNLAKFLAKQGDPADAEEIMACFETEESYFRKTSEWNDLVISLANQALYYSDKPGKTELAMQKLQEANRIASDKGLSQFRRVLRAILNSMRV